MSGHGRSRLGLQAFVRSWWHRARYGARAIVLAYHRVARLQSDPFGLAVTPSHFHEHLEVLMGVGTPVRFDELHRSLSRASRRETLVCVTFDDGYADNLHVARPLLERHAIPATVFITSGQLDGAREFWWDEIDQLIELEDDEQFGRAPDSSGPPSIPRGTPAKSDRVRTLREQLYSMSARERTDLLNERWNERGATPTVRPTHATLSSMGVAELARDGLIEIGAHTVSHPHLPALSPQAQDREIVSSKRALEELVDAPVTSFAYPFGATSSSTRDRVKNAGFSAACTVEPDCLSGATDRWMIPRLLVPDCNGDELAGILRSHLARAPRSGVGA